MRNGQACQQKTEKFSISEEKKFGKIDSWFCWDIFAKLLENPKLLPKRMALVSTFLGLAIIFIL